MGYIFYFLVQSVYGLTKTNSSFHGVLFKQKVLTEVLEEAGYQKDSVLVQADFMKVIAISAFLRYPEAL